MGVELEKFVMNFFLIYIWCSMAIIFISYTIYLQIFSSCLTLIGMSKKCYF